MDSITCLSPTGGPQGALNSHCVNMPRTKLFNTAACICNSAQSGCARFAPLPLLPVLLLLLLPPLLLLLFLHSLGVCSYAG